MKAAFQYRFALRLVVGGLGIASLLVASGCAKEMKPPDHTVAIRPGEGVQGAVPPTITARRGETIEWTNHDAVPHRIVFEDSPGKHPKSPQTIDLAPNGGKGNVKVHKSKPGGGYHYEVVPSANPRGEPGPGEPQVVVGS